MTFIENFQARQKSEDQLATRLGGMETRLNLLALVEDQSRTPPDSTIIPGLERAGTLVADIRNNPLDLTPDKRWRLLDKRDLPAARKTYDGWMVKSETLEALEKFRKDAPWSSRMELHFVQGTNVAGYVQGQGEKRDKDYLLIGMMTEADVRKQLGDTATDAEVQAELKKHSEHMVESYAHVLYCSTHQSLHKLYGGQKPLEDHNFVAIKLNNKAGAYLAEIKVNRELGHSQPVMFGNQNLNELIVFKDKEKKVIDEEATQREIAKFLQPRLGHHFRKEHQESYLRYFAVNRKHLIDNGFLKEGY